VREDPEVVAAAAATELRLRLHPSNERQQVLCLDARAARPHARRRLEHAEVRLVHRVLRHEEQLRGRRVVGHVRRRLQQAHEGQLQDVHVGQLQPRLVRATRHVEVLHSARLPQQLFTVVDVHTASLHHFPHVTQRELKGSHR
jgi:hypothetical protein